MRKRKWRVLKSTINRWMVPGEDVICARRFRRMEKCEVSMQITGRKGAARGVIVMYEVRSRCMETGFDGWEVEGFHSAKGERVKWNNSQWGNRRRLRSMPLFLRLPVFDKFSIHLSCVCSCANKCGSFYLHHSTRTYSGDKNACFSLTFTIQCIYIFTKKRDENKRESFQIILTEKSIYIIDKEISEILQ